MSAFDDPYGFTRAYARAERHLERIAVALEKLAEKPEPPGLGKYNGLTGSPLKPEDFRNFPEKINYPRLGKKP